MFEHAITRFPEGKAPEDSEDSGPDNEDFKKAVAPTQPNSKGENSKDSEGGGAPTTIQEGGWAPTMIQEGGGAPVT
jgi:hypothetical protein